MSGWRMALLLLAGVSYACVSHWMMVFHPAEPWAVVVLLGPLWLTALGLLGSRFGGWGLATAAVAGVAVFALVWSGGAGDVDRLYVLQHVGINALLCGWFGATLRPGRLSLIGQFAERVHPLSPAMHRYTAQVTRVWAWYFALVAAGSVAIYLWLPFSAWSLFANLLTPLGIGTLFIGEYLLRYRLHPEFERTPMIVALRAVFAASADRGTRH